MRKQSAAWPYLRDLAAGNLVPAELYVQDYKDGTRPLWTVHSTAELLSGGRMIVLVDPATADEEVTVAVTVLTWPNSTMRTQPHVLGEGWEPILMDMDQQARHVARKALARKAVA